MEDLIVLLVIFGVISSFTQRIKKNVKPRNSDQSQQRNVNQRPVQNQANLSGQRPAQSRYQLPSNSRTKPVQKMDSAEAIDSIQDGFGRLVKRLTGEDIFEDKSKKQNQLEEQRRYKEKVALEKELLADEAYEASRVEAIRWRKENEDENEIGDLPELEDDITDMIDENYVSTVSSKFNLSEAKQGIIWAEILARPKPLQKGERKLS